MVHVVGVPEAPRSLVLDPLVENAGLYGTAFDDVRVRFERAFAVNPDRVVADLRASWNSCGDDDGCALSGWQPYTFDHT